MIPQGENRAFFLFIRGFSARAEFDRIRSDPTCGACGKLKILIHRSTCFSPFKRPAPGAFPQNGRNFRASVFHKIRTFPFFHVFFRFFDKEGGFFHILSVVTVRLFHKLPTSAVSGKSAEYTDQTALFGGLSSVFHRIHRPYVYFCLLLSISDLSYLSRASKTDFPFFVNRTRGDALPIGESKNRDRNNNLTTKGNHRK